MQTTAPQYDVIIIGGGPAGAVAALTLARAGRKAIVLEKAKFPRFHIGESFLAQSGAFLRSIGLEEQIEKLPHLKKYGAELALGNDEENAINFSFEDGLIPGAVTFNIERSIFDEMLLNEAAKAGAEVRQECGVQKIVRVKKGDCAVMADGAEITAKYLFDASGQNTVLARHLNIRENLDDPDLKKVAYFQHFENVERLPGIETGHPTLIMCREGWFWIIGLSETKTSVGFVTSPDFAKKIGVSANQLLQWAIARCPVVRRRMQNAIGPTTNDVAADFSYRCRPCAGDGYFLLGDAAAFLDPVFSTGVTLALRSGHHAAKLAIDLLSGKTSEAKARSSYIRFMNNSTGMFWRLIRGYYQHSFRELFLAGTGPLKIHAAVISALAGQVFPKPAWKLRWRVRVFEWLVQINKYRRMVPERKEHSLLADEPEIDIPMNAVPAVAHV